MGRQHINYGSQAADVESFSVEAPTGRISEGNTIEIVIPMMEYMKAHPQYAGLEASSSVCSKNCLFTYQSAIHYLNQRYMDIWIAD